MNQPTLALHENSESLLRRQAPKNGLLKWIGNKQRFAAKIVSYFPERFGTYFEPFVGSGAVLATLWPSRGVASDSFPPLVDIWKTLRQDPAAVKRWYRERWTYVSRGDKKRRYAHIRLSYNRSPNAADLVFLCRSCYGGVVRFRRDGFMSTPCGVHTPISPESFDARVDEWHERVRDTEFILCDYNAAMRRARRGDLVYCDPPYVFTQRILYGAQEFAFEKLLSEIADCKRRGVFVALSIDGRKRSGRESLFLDLPSGLFEREIFIEGGASMLKRFQSRGISLDKERVADRLLLSY